MAASMSLLLLYNVVDASTSSSLQLRRVLNIFFIVFACLLFICLGRLKFWQLLADVDLPAAFTGGELPKAVQTVKILLNVQVKLQTNEQWRSEAGTLTDFDDHYTISRDPYCFTLHGLSGSFNAWV